MDFFSSMRAIIARNGVQNKSRSLVATIARFHYSVSMNIAASAAKQTILNSLLSESAFGKIQAAIDLNEEGLLAESACGPDELFTQKARFSFKPFRFDGTEAEKQSGQVLFTGKGFGGRPLLAVLQSSDAAQKARAVFAYASCVTQAIKEGRALPANGAGGVLYKEAKGKASLLFLPQNIFEFSARNAASKDYSLLQAVWQDKNLLDARAPAFVRACVVYQALAGCFPFPAENMEERQADIFDAKYLPIQNSVNGINPRLAAQISYALEYGSAAFEQKLQESGLSKNGAGKGDGGAKVEWLDKDFALAELAAELGLKADGSVAAVERKSAVSQKEFEEEAKKILGKKAARAGASRTLRRNRALFIAGVFLIAGSLFFGRSVRRDKLMRPTTISLSPRQTAEVFFSGLHTMNTILMQAASGGKSAKSLVESTSNIYVASKMRDAFSQTVGTVTPELYLYRPDLSDKWIFGITNFELGEDSSSLTQADNKKSAPLYKEKPVPLSVKNGSEKKLAVRFFRVHNEGGESDISVEKIQGSATLVFKKDRWLVNDITFPQDEKIYSMKEFADDRADAMQKADGDPIEAAKILRQKYEWIPSAREMAAARIEVETKMRQE